MYLRSKKVVFLVTEINFLLLYYRSIDINQNTYFEKAFIDIARNEFSHRAIYVICLRVKVIDLLLDHYYCDYKWEYSNANCPNSPFNQVQEWS